MKNLFIIQNFLKNNLTYWKNGNAPTSEVCGRLSHHHCHKLPFHVVYVAQ
jgi:hypothetical protein